MRVSDFVKHFMWGAGSILELMPSKSLHHAEFHAPVSVEAAISNAWGDVGSAMRLALESSLRGQEAQVSTTEKSTELLGL